VKRHPLGVYTLNCYPFCAKEKQPMKIVSKTIVALLISAIVPVVVFFLLGYFIAFIVGIGNLNLGELFGKPTDLITSFLLWAVISVSLVAPFSFGHVFFLGLPIFLVSWHFRAIRWWSTLVIAFMIGALPSTIFVFFFQDIGWSERSYFYQKINVLSLGFTAVAAITMGFFGLAGGIVFWLLWRYWVSPNSPEGRPFSSLHDVEIKPSSVNE